MVPVWAQAHPTLAFCSFQRVHKRALFTVERGSSDGAYTIMRAFSSLALGHIVVEKPGLVTFDCGGSSGGSGDPMMLLGIAMASVWLLDSNEEGMKA